MNQIDTLCERKKEREREREREKERERERERERAGEKKVYIICHTKCNII